MVIWTSRSKLILPGFDYDLSHHWSRERCIAWMVLSLQHTIRNKQSTLLEVTASQNDKDYIAAINWKLAEAVC